MTITREDFQKLSDGIADLRRDIQIRFAKMDSQFATVDAKLDAKPGYGAMATLAFGIGAVIASTVVVLT